jgi:hypothetical protein
VNDVDGGKTFALNGSLQHPHRWLIGIMLISAAIAVIALAFGLSHAAPQSRAPLRLGMALLPLVLLLAWLSIMRVLRRAGVRVDQGTLIVNTGIGSKRIVLTRLRAHGMRVLDLAAHPELKPVFKLFGTGLPGFAGGWFRLRNGDKAVCLLLDRSRVSWLRSDEDEVTLLLSLAEPERLRALLER